MNVTDGIAQRLMAEYTGILIDGVWQAGEGSFPVLDKYTLAPAAEVSRASRRQVAQAVSQCKAAADRGAPAARERAAILRRAAGLLDAYRQDFEAVMMVEGGFTVHDISAELTRAKVTLELSADEALRLTGSMVPFQASPGAEHKLGFTVRVPVGVVAAITPFNAPLNTVLHKVAPAFAAGNSVVLKPSAFTPLTSALLARVLLEAGMPPEFLAVVQGEGDDVGTWLLEEQDVAFYTFTGSTRVGRIIQRAAGLRRTQMELGSIASTIVCADADLEAAVPRIANAAFRKAGQVCTSIQRLYVEDALKNELIERLSRYLDDMPAGDPRAGATRVGPMISEAAAARAQAWIAEAVEAGARLVRGGERQGAVVQPAVLADVPESCSAWSTEVFSPMVSIRGFARFDDVLASANDTPYGLAAGIFTNDHARIMSAVRALRFGTVHINETSSARCDVMPFGGVKDSGFGKEGPGYAAREMTEERLIVFNQ
ncbi:aldehyde dehydrogenase family protein [Bordetella bronchiseptica]|uniref:aldehyde dehydrogenase family protein n=1 Tax=Bordetella bronchiseptica TaxID=518 RepID=UPI003EDCA926